MKRIISLSLAVLLLLTVALAVGSCGGDTTKARCYICHQEFEKSDMDSGELLDEIVYICYDCLEGLNQPEDVTGDSHDHDHDHDH